MRGKGFTATEIASKIAEAFELSDNLNIMPMTDQDVETWIQTKRRRDALSGISGEKKDAA